LSRRPVLLFVSLLLAAGRAGAEFPHPPPAQADDLFASAAESMEQGDAASAEAELAELARRFPQRAWIARIGLLRAHALLDAGGRGAAEAFAGVDAAPIGLAAYRDEFLGEALEGAGESAAARSAYRRALAEGPFARQARAAAALGRLASTPEEEREALGQAERATPSATGDDVAALLEIRVRLALRLADREALGRAADDWLFRGRPAEMPPELALEARRRLAGYSAEKRLALARRQTRTGDYAEALRDLGPLSAGRLTPLEGRLVHLLRARALEGRGRHAAAIEEARQIVPDGSAEDFQARLLTAQSELELATARPRAHGRRRRAAPPPAPDWQRLGRLFARAAVAAAPVEVRRAALSRIVRIALEAQDRGWALSAARSLAAIAPNSTAGFEGLWRPTMEKIVAGHWGPALEEIEELRAVYRAIPAARRLDYWRARCLAGLGARRAAEVLDRRLAAANPPDLYARFAAGGRLLCSGLPEAPELPDRGEFARVDELLRLRLYAEAAWEAGLLSGSPGRDLRLAIADFGLGRFAQATLEVKAAYPQIGTAREGEVPEEWRRLYYPIDNGEHVEAAAEEFGIDRALLLGLVRQESTFNAAARSRAGAVGLTQLMPRTARELSRSVLGRRFRRSFLYDPRVNARLGASYLRFLLDRFGGREIFAVAAYNGGPGRIGAYLRDNPGLPDDQALEMIPAAETRDYVRRVFLYAESYRELYPAGSE
jgi:soluble lytic murein transglycosylase